LPLAPVISIMSKRWNFKGLSSNLEIKSFNHQALGFPIFPASDPKAAKEKVFHPSSENPITVPAFGFPREPSQLICFTRILFRNLFQRPNQSGGKLGKQGICFPLF